MVTVYTWCSMWAVLAVDLVTFSIIYGRSVKFSDVFRTRVSESLRERLVMWQNDCNNVSENFVSRTFQCKVVFVDWLLWRKRNKTLRDEPLLRNDLLLHHLQRSWWFSDSSLTHSVEEKEYIQHLGCKSDRLRFGLKGSLYFLCDQDVSPEQPRDRKHPFQSEQRAV